MESEDEIRKSHSPGDKAENEQERIDNGSGGIVFGDQAVVQGDVVGGNKYEIRFYAQDFRYGSGQASWDRYRPKPQSISEEPYKFLSYYDTLDAEIFYGREVVSDSLVSKISNHKLVLINGKSGSGKTSLINAGIVPGLTQRGYFTIIFRDYGYPTDIIKAGIDSLKNVDIDLSDSMTLAEVLQKTYRDTKRPIAIFLDQFERFFLNLQVYQQGQFIQEFSECLNSIKAQEIAFIISVRQDFYGNLGEFWKASPEFNTESYQYYLESLSCSEALDAIKKPLHRLYPNIIYDPEFLENKLLPHLLKDTSEKASLQVEPVHLQIVCNRLFDEVITRNQQKLQDGETIIIKESLYQELGDVQGILQGYVDSILDRFTPKEREEAKSILKQMVTGQGTRAFKSLSEIKTQLKLSENKVENIIQQLEHSRLIETIQTIPSETKYSLTHEYLVEKVSQWCDISESEIKIAQELFERCLINWKLNYKSSIPREQFQRIKRYKPHLNIDEEGEKLLKYSSQLYYGINLLIGFAIFGLFIFLAIPLVLRLQAAWQGEMVKISSGEFVFGTDEPNADKEEKPKRRIYLPEFEIEKYQVSNRQYNLCVRVRACSLPVVELKRFINRRTLDLDNHPVVGVTSVQANEYCHWLGRRLPTELEWERTARGSNGRLWPWGDTNPTLQHANIVIDSNKPENIKPVKSFPKGRSPEGVYNLVGNAWEWTASYFDGYSEPNKKKHIWNGQIETLTWGKKLTLRGGGWNSPLKRVTYRYSNDPEITNNTIGIRCAK